ncbi:hypothetical protein, partial [Streptomyces sp. NPDC053720]|uniref:hypothetical protein n=1 Tax=Streptomyces sp. NPDC053720 TaxID=3154855 RepID=UPI003423596C
MQLHIIHIGRGNPRIRIRQPQDFLLPLRARRGQTLTTPVIRNRATRDHTDHVVPVSDRIHQPLQHDKTATLTPHI